MPTLKQLQHWKYLQNLKPDYTEWKINQIIFQEIIRVACFEENLVTSDPAFYEIQGISDFKQVADVANKILKRFN